VLVHRIQRPREEGDTRFIGFSRFGFAMLALVPLVAGVVFVLVWPRLWSHPIAHLTESWLKLRKPHGPELYLGRMVNHAPWSYFPAYLLATAPLGILIGAVAFVLRTVTVPGGRRPGRALLLWMIVPLG